MRDPFKYIEAYLDNQLSDEDRILFEEELKSQAQLQEVLQQTIIAKELSKSLIELETRKQLAYIKNESKFKLWAIGIAAGLVICILGYWILKYQESADDSSLPDSDQVFAALYERPAESTFRKEFHLSNALDSGIYYFDKNELENAYPLFMRALQTDSLNLKVWRYVSHTFMLQKKYIEASELLLDLYQSSQEPYATEALYHLTIIDLLNHNINEAKIKWKLLEKNPLVPPDKLTAMKRYLE